MNLPMEDKVYSVYMHVFPNGKKYIGLTMQQPIEKRWGSNGCGYKACPKMYAAILKFEWKNVQHYVIRNGLTKAEAEDLEIKLIAYHNSIADGYNIEHGGNTSGTHNEETKQKISNWNKGKVYSGETLKRMREAHKGKGKGKENSFFGKHHSEETKQKQSDFMKGNDFFKGKHHSEEFKKMKSLQMSEKYSEGRNPRCKRVCMTTKEGAETVFWSLRQAAETADVSVATMFKYVKNGIIKNGCTWRYLDEP